MGKSNIYLVMSQKTLKKSQFIVYQRDKFIIIGYNVITFHSV